ncbi:MAG: acyl-ACP--UDP-N-acetylglucosamine O-acyltransferase [Candidatus Omnitrophica bacterium]|nr:acyl-ACP--UDP-N-acetylglucosamine O-acyltransferase [Candidatus Omnitrophota bacterium]
MSIHPTAIVDKKSNISSDVEIGPYAIIESDVKIGKGVKIYPHSHIMNYTEIGDGTRIHTGAVLGDVPQDIAFKGGKTSLIIGKNNIIREYVTIHRGTKEGSSTVIGDNNYFMGTSHLGHNCDVGNNVIVANGALLAGYVTVEDAAFISGNVVIHQFSRIGTLSMIGGFSGVNKDVPPYMSVRGPSVVCAVNLVGLRRAGIDRKAITEIKEAYKIIYHSDINTKQAVEKILERNPGKEVKYLVDFIKNSKRGICKYRYDSDDKGYYS